jgi:hypothetical protein
MTEPEPSASVIDASMNLYIKEKMRADTAYEMNTSSKSTYTHDLIYLFFKSLLFGILGGVFYYLFKQQDPSEILTQAKDKAVAVTKVVDDVAKAVKEKVKVDPKPEIKA